MSPIYFIDLKGRKGWGLGGGEKREGMGDTCNSENNKKKLKLKIKKIKSMVSFFKKTDIGDSASMLGNTLAITS